MRKRVLVSALIGFLFIISGCGKESVSVFENDGSDGVLTTLSYYHTGDKVTKQTTKTVLNYQEAGFESQELAREVIEPISKEYKETEGIDYHIRYEEEEAIEEFTVDYTVLDFDKANAVTGFMIVGDAKNGISMRESRKLLKEEGYHEKD